MLATLGATALAVFVFGVPLRGSLAALLLLSATFMVPALGQGLLISSVTRNQFLAAQIALFSGFLPAFMLSGFLYEIDAMPAPIRAIRSEEHTSELQSLMRISYAVFCLKKKKNKHQEKHHSKIHK